MLESRAPVQVVDAGPLEHVVARRRDHRLAQGRLRAALPSRYFQRDGRLCVVAYPGSHADARQRDAHAVESMSRPAPSADGGSSRPKEVGGETMM